MPKTPPPEKVEWVAAAAASDTDSCIDWPFTTVNGYACIGGRRKVSHMVLEAAGHPRPAPPANHALHSCDRPVCANPRHLRWGTHADNMRDIQQRGSRKGEAAHRARLTNDQVLELRSLHAQGATQRALAARYGIGKSQVQRIVSRERWSHI